jgi:hypothetical protein
MEVCPTDVILAPAERVWRLLTNPHELAQGSGTKLVEGPARAVSAGDRLVSRAGMLHIIFEDAKGQRNVERELLRRLHLEHLRAIRSAGVGKRVGQLLGVRARRAARHTATAGERNY